MPADPAWIEPLVEPAAQALAVHRWKQASFRFVSCECGWTVQDDHPDFDWDAALRAHLARAVLAAVAEALPAKAVAGDTCVCPPCPGRGTDGHGVNHCAECCWGTGVEADMDCPIHGCIVQDAAAIRAAARAEMAEGIQTEARKHAVSRRSFLGHGPFVESITVAELDDIALQAIARTAAEREA